MPRGCRTDRHGEVVEEHAVGGHEGGARVHSKPENPKPQTQTP